MSLSEKTRLDVAQTQLRRLETLTDCVYALALILPEAWIAGYRGLVQQPMVSLIGIVIVWNLIGEIFWPLFLGAIGLLYPGVYYG